MQDLLAHIKSDYPAINFEESDYFCWSPKNHLITYRFESMRPEISHWSLLHELGHAELNHLTYHSDFELVSLEVAAWQKAIHLGKHYKVAIDGEHIQDCLDTYRNWLYRRSSCPDCGTVSLQDTPEQYTCFNCRCSWYVTASRFCRPYRSVKRLKPQKNTAPTGSGAFL